jgi:hypothetical protein
MLHAEQKAKSQNSEHAHPNPTLTNGILVKDGVERPTFHRTLAKDIHQSWMFDWGAQRHSRYADSSDSV